MSIARCTREDFLDSRGFIKRPRNAYMIWLQETRKKVQNERRIHHQSDICTALGRQWHHVPTAEKRHYQELARRERETHDLLFIDYRYQPGRRMFGDLFVSKVPLPQGASGPKKVQHVPKKDNASKSSQNKVPPKRSQVKRPVPPVINVTPKKCNESVSKSSQKKVPPKRSQVKRPILPVINVPPKKYNESVSKSSQRKVCTKMSQVKRSLLKTLMMKTPVTSVPLNAKSSILIPNVKKNTVPVNKVDVINRKSSTHVPNLSEGGSSFKRKLAEAYQQAPSAKKSCNNNNNGAMEVEPLGNNNPATIISLSATLVVKNISEVADYESCDISIKEEPLEFSPRYTSTPTPPQESSYPENILISDEIKIEPMCDLPLLPDNIQVEPDTQADKLERDLQYTCDNIKTASVIEIDWSSDFIFPDIVSNYSSFVSISDISQLEPFELIPPESNPDLLYMPHLGCDLQGIIPSQQSLMHCCCLQSHSIGNFCVPSQLPSDFLQ